MQSTARVFRAFCPNLGDYPGLAPSDHAIIESDQRVISRSAIVLCVSTPHMNRYRQASGLSESCPTKAACPRAAQQKRRRTEVSVSPEWQPRCRRQANELLQIELK